MNTGDAHRSPPEERGRIELVREGRVLRGPCGASILHALQENGVPIGSSCGGQGTCGECRIRFVELAPEAKAADLEHLNPSEIAAGWRLACSHAIGGRARIEIRAATGELNHKALHDGGTPTGGLDPAVRCTTIRLDPASTDDQRPLTERLLDEIGHPLEVPVAVLRQLAEIPRSAAVLSVVEFDGKVLDVRSGECEICGVAIDVGTTTLAAYLFDLASGCQLGSAASRNPQRRFGADVIARIAHVRREPRDGLVRLHTAVIGGLNALIGELVEEAGVPYDTIYAATVVGNPTMLHLFLGIDPRGIDVSPYAPVVGRRVRCGVEDVGLAMHTRGVIETLPAISAYVGADIVAGILATDLQSSEANTLFLDVGTNGEMVLALGDRLIACSTAAGPAFEGASIVQGMAALDGAIEVVRVHEGRIDCSAIGGVAPVGLCGTGLLSAVAELRMAGLIDPTGRFSDVESRIGDRLDGEGKERRIRLTDGVEPVYLYQQDVREFQLAKAAVRVGIETLLQYAGLQAGDLERVLIGGAFSTRLAPAHLIETGFLPRVDVARIHVVGNAAGQGAKQVLLNEEMMGRADEIARLVEYVELSSDPEFNERFVERISFPETG